MIGRLVGGAALGVVAAKAYDLVVEGTLTLDTGIGRRVRGPVPHLSEAFELHETDAGTELTWRGELGTDFGRIGARWGRLVAHSWARAVERSIAAVKAEAERRRPVHPHPPAPLS